MAGVRFLFGGALPAAAIVIRHIVIHQPLEFLGDAFALERDGFHPVHEHRRDRGPVRTRQADTDIGLLAFAGTVDHATHHPNTHLPDPWVLRPPYRHLPAQIPLDLLRQFLD